MLRTILVFLILIPGLFLACRSRFNGLLLYLWFAFFRPQNWAWIDLTSLRLSMVLGLVLIVPSILGGSWPNLTHVLSVGSLLFLATSFVAHANAANPVISAWWLNFFVPLVLITLFTVSLTNTPRRLIAVLAVVAGSLGFHASKAGLASVISGGAHFEDGLSGAFVDNNGYALATVMVMPLLLAVAQNLDVFEDLSARMKRWGRRCFYVAIPLCAMTVVSTFSRGGFLALAGVAVCYTMLHPRRIRFALAWLVVLPLAITLAPLPKGYTQRLDSIRSFDDDDEGGDRSAEGRLHFWQVAITMAEAQPLGVGLGNFEYLYDRYDSTNGEFGHNRAVHNSSFQVLAELGYFGAAVWLMQFLVGFWCAFRVRARSRTPGLPPDSAKLLLSVSNAIICSMVGFIIGGSFIALALNDLTWITFGVLAALDLISRRMCAAARPQPAVQRDTTVLHARSA